MTLFCCVAVIISDFHIYLVVSTRECDDLDHIGGLVLSCRLVTPIIASIIRAGQHQQQQTSNSTTAVSSFVNIKVQCCPFQGNLGRVILPPPL